MTTPRLSASIVTYQSPPGELLRLLESICVAMEAVRNSEVRGRGVATLVIHLIDNADIPELDVRLIGVDKTRLTLAGITLVLHQGWGNVGYGRGHNRVLPLLNSDFHLVLNTDVEMASTSLIKAIDYLETAPETVLISPAATDFLGNKQHLCKSYPSLFIFWLRGFAPPFIRRKFAKHMAAYERRDLETRPSATTDNNVASPVEIASGCCMLCRTAALQQVHGFDSDFFLYFEDFDLSLRLGKLGDVVYLPSMRVRHGGGNAATKGGNHQRYFLRSALRFFNKNGWKLF
jgi:GT2 family glycosyltransferase